ncbi:ammonium transporter Amt3 [Parelaphostrongylus tenuis]|uniref:Ammonium transporter Amt3 n=1 Tax=Parelaphostrongylus tenuis TaxID=148309 RepID=A0AAD5NDA2_PARTN|nr:ammonium transporter Amt3 [Parelaphostrongylus tenuis]
MSPQCHPASRKRETACRQIDKEEVDRTRALPAHWVWDSEGFFYKLGVVDFAGCSAVHMVGGIIGLIATVYLKPRRNRFNEDSVHQMSSPTNALLGTFLLWWGWFGINAGSVWGITSGRWRLGARAAVATIMSSIGGGVTSIVISFIKTKKLQVNFLINGILSSIVSITALCAMSRPWHALIIGGVSSAFSILVLPLLERLKVDDPVGIVPIHLTSSIWGMIAVGIFCEKDRHLIGATNGHAGVLYSGSFALLGVQLLCTITVLVYSASFGLLILVLISKSPLGLRVTDYEEQIGADVIEHGLAGTNVARYVVEKPLSTRTFQTVTKAITKWKMLAKSKSRQKRLEQARLKRLNEDQAFNSFTQEASIANGAAQTGNGMLYNRRMSRILETATTAFSPVPKEHQYPANTDIEAQSLGNRRKSTAASQRSMKSLRSNELPLYDMAKSLERTSNDGDSPRPVVELPQSEHDSQNSKTSNSNISRKHQVDDRPNTTSQISAEASSAPRNTTVGKFVRPPPARTLSPPEDISIGADDDERSVSSAPVPFGKNNKIAPQ